ncbi:AraC family transcriptional regulator [Stappia sp.]|uniref:helix-turn-helix domain-containing protein n=1 Tax=Stappia sp. TaxID=1870903 RepID=UPI0025EBB90E|nr:AraC family transcriptional regulator [Stappia sp.]
MEGSVDFKGEDILAADLKAQSVLTGPDFKVVRPLAFARKAVLRGDHRMVRLRPGLSVHTSDTTTLQDLTTAIEQPAGLTVMVFLEGDVDASIGGVPLEVGRKQDGPVRGVMVSRARADRFVRRARKGERMRKVVVTCSPEWVADCGFDGSLERNVVAEFCATHLARFEWVASPAFVAIAEQMLHSPRSPCYPEHLYLESRALDLLGEAFSALGERGGSHAHPTLSPSDQRRLQLVEDTIAASAGEAPTVERIARQCGMSVSSLQRLFRLGHGVSVSDHIRRASLLRARHLLEREGVSVAEAAHRAGYSSPANFATAFKRAFGLSPRDARRSARG